MKKLLIIALTITLVLTLAAGCGNNSSDAKDSKGSSAAVQLDPKVGDLGELSAKTDGASLEGLINSNDSGMMTKAQTAPVNEDWVTVSASE